jgi:hypothetical protein
MVDRLAASAIASASAVSFFWRLNKRLDVRRRDQADFISGVADSPTLVMCAPAGLHGDDAAWPLGTKAEYLLTRDLLSKGYASIR